MNFFLLDNYDSFVYNLASYILELNYTVIVRKPEEITIKEIKELNIEGIIISPGPGKPIDAIFALEVLDFFKGTLPILGVCLGHQVICHYFGSLVEKGKKPMHGKISKIEHNGKNLFEGIKSPLNVTRYHSLCVTPTHLSKELTCDALSDDKVVMAASHSNMPIYGLQFHPEALLTENGKTMISNFIKICNKWKETHI